ncbi:uncharacterized protein LOC124153106 isoform X2 [Haliotis rufescens]|uniref:uncharacterized protein LOC124153106 isoform X2 n=1 Tax=Haliotis rufescens TaxID=6454 RepID=UPI00201F9865|nr:uncharacterized protein LOC124153106 isoform X2 [Haliotis rufescens]
MNGRTATFLAMFICFQESFTNELVGCYGDGSDESDFFTPSCDSPKVIVIEHIYAFAKKANLGCALAAFGADYDRGKCCTYDANDYKSLYKGISLSEYLSACVGKSRCMRPVTRQGVNMTYVDAGYMAFTTYMVMDFSCVLETYILDPTSNQTASHTTVFIKSEENTTSRNDVSCRVAAPCDTSIIIESIHFYSNGSHTNLEITDGNNSQTLLCPGNNFTGVTYTSENSSVQITLSNMTKGTWLWVQIKGSNGDVINISCNSEEASSGEACTAGTTRSGSYDEDVAGSIYSNNVNSVCENDKRVTTVDPRSTGTSAEPSQGTSTPGPTGSNTPTEPPQGTSTPGPTGSNTPTEPPQGTSTPGPTGSNTPTEPPQDSWQIPVAVVLVVLVLAVIAGYVIKRKFRKTQGEVIPLMSTEVPPVAPATTALVRRPRRLEPLDDDPSHDSPAAPSVDTVPKMWHTVRSAYTVNKAATQLSKNGAVKTDVWHLEPRGK